MKEYVIGGLVIGVDGEIGPRILKLAPGEKPGKNLFGVLPGTGVETAEGFWNIYGGHRLWTAPEAKPRSYSLDDSPVRVETGKEHIKIYGNMEINNAVQKEIEIKAGEKGGVEVVHRIKNTGRWRVELACWALTVMKKGGFAILPVKRGCRQGLLPDRKLILWPYTDLSDRRLVMDRDFIFLQQDKNTASPCKIGVSANPSWAAYWVDGFLFTKRFAGGEGPYPDFGCSVEAYTNAEMLELETLGALKNLEPGNTAEHKEVWSVQEVGALSPCQDAVDKVPGVCF